VRPALARTGFHQRGVHRTPDRHLCCRRPCQPKEHSPRTPREIETHRWLADAPLSRQWFEHAILHYRKYLLLRPDNPAALTKLGLALVSPDATEEGIHVLRRAVALEIQNVVDARSVAVAKR
jgi:hypothetical protein